MDVLNIKLNSIGSVRSLPVNGDFISYFCMVDDMSSLLKPSIYCRQANTVTHSECYKLQPLEITNKDVNESRNARVSKKILVLENLISRRARNSPTHKAKLHD